MKAKRVQSAGSPASGRAARECISAEPIPAPWLANGQLSSTCHWCTRFCTASADLVQRPHLPSRRPRPERVDDKQTGAQPCSRWAGACRRQALWVCSLQCRVHTRPSHLCRGEATSWAPTSPQTPSPRRRPTTLTLRTRCGAAPLCHVRTAAPPDPHQLAPAAQDEERTAREAALDKADVVGSMRSTGGRRCTRTHRMLTHVR